MARPSDAGILSRIDAETGSGGAHARFRSLCDTGAAGSERLLVYEEAGRPRGFVRYASVLDEASIYNIAVSPSCQGRGLGRLLLGALLEKLRLEGIRICLLEVRESNRVARGLYESLGFGLDGRRKDYYSAPPGREDALLMSLKL